MYNYNPEIKNPEPYEPSNEIFKSLNYTLEDSQKEEPVKEDKIYEDDNIINNQQQNIINNNLEIKDDNIKYNNLSLKKENKVINGIL